MDLKRLIFIGVMLSGCVSMSEAQNVGINQPNPIWPLDILSPQAVARLVSTTTNFGSTLELKNTNPSAQYLGAINFNDPGTTYPGQISYTSDHKMSFRVGGVERMMIDNMGRIGIGGAPEISDIEIHRPDGKLEVRTNGMVFRTYDPNTIGCGVITFTNWGGFSGQIFYGQDHKMIFSCDGSIPLRLYPNGLVGVNRIPVTNNLEVGGNASKSTAGDWIGNSDARLKKNIEPLESQEMLEKVLALQGITYEWNDDKTGSIRPDGIQFGFTAQNIEEAFPSLVEEDCLGYLQTAYGTLDPMIIEAIRALNTKITDLQEEVSALRHQLDLDHHADATPVLK